MTELERELHDSGEAMSLLVGAGVPRRSILLSPLWGAVGMASVLPVGSDLFEVVEGPGRNVARVVLIGVRDDDCDVLDLVGWIPGQPGRFRRLIGTVDFLGQEAVLKAGLFGEPLLLHPTPLAWLAAGGSGACVLDSTASLSLAFAGIPEIHATCPVLGASIDKRLRSEAELSRPRIMIPDHREAA